MAEVRRFPRKPLYLGLYRPIWTLSFPPHPGLTSAAKLCRSFRAALVNASCDLLTRILRL
jgi:hypothetical protein